MLTGLVSIVALAAPYSSTLIYRIATSSARSVIRSNVLTANETIAGFTCESVGNHGETFSSTPFVWSKGKFSGLPLLPKSEYGKVLDGNDKVLIGWSSIGPEEWPVKWTPHAGRGWAKPSVTRLDDNPGEAIHLDPAGRIWIKSQDKGVGHFIKGRWQGLSTGQFIFTGVDAKGNVFGNKFSGIGYAHEHLNTVPGWFSGTAWQSLSKGKSAASAVIWAVNSQGVAVGNLGNRIAIWRNGSLEHPSIPDCNWSDARAISPTGAVLGTGTRKNNRWFEFLWQDGRLHDLTDVVAGVKLDSLNKINSKGAIAATARLENEARLYLLRPRQ